MARIGTMEMDKMSAKKDGLKELVDPSKLDENNLKVIYEIVMKIFHDVDYEVPNSATFSMAMDSIEQQEKIYSIKDKKRKTIEIEEINQVK